jgi:hypothetical protein
MTEFEDLCVQASADILAGSLEDEPHFSQVGEASWALLSAINAAGFLTDDSQSGEDPDERAYVTGVMPTAAADEFSQRMNMVGDFVALTLESGERFGNGIPVTRSSAPYGEFFEDRQTSGVDRYRAQTRIPVYMCQRSHEFEIMQTGLASPQKYRLVAVFDPKWGRPGYEDGNLFGAVLECLKDTTIKSRDEV